VLEGFASAGTGLNLRFRDRPKATARTENR
jgi:hypothetical protein